MTLPIFDTVLNGKSVIGSIVGTRNDLADVFALHAAGRTKVIAKGSQEDSVRELSGAAPDNVSPTSGSEGEVAVEERALTDGRPGGPQRLLLARRPHRASQSENSSPQAGQSRASSPTWWDSSWRTVA